jgi:hypothetical protein
MTFTLVAIGAAVATCGLPAAALGPVALGSIPLDENPAEDR